MQQAFAAMDAWAHVIGTDNLASVPAATWLTAHATQQSTQQQSDPSSWSSYGDFYNGAWMLLADWIIRTTPSSSVTRGSPHC